MADSDSMREAFLEAVCTAGGQSAFASLMSLSERAISQQLVSYWLKKGELPAEFVLRAERLTGVSRYRLRPDVFCMPSDLEGNKAAA
jgi:DNA-binding transcriptional regulator YdaS (Cro superfamily)